jgi:hypothetical protein
VHNSPQGNQGFVRMFDGDRYDIGELDVFDHSAWKSGLLNLNADDLRSGNENGDLDFSWGSAVSLKGDVDILTARTPFYAGGTIINNQWNPNPYNYQYSTNTTNSQDYFKRNFQNEEITLSLPTHPEYRFFAGNWLVQDRGTQPQNASTGVEYQNNINRFTRENSLGLDGDISDKGQAYVEYSFRKFMDYSVGFPSTTLKTQPTKLNIPNQDVNSYKLAFRYNPSVNLSFAGSAITRARQNQFNGFTQFNYAGNLSTSYRPSKDLSLTARLYENAYQTHPNDGFSAGAGAIADDIDFLFLKGDFDARYTGLDNAVLTASYRPDYTRRSGAENWAINYSALSYQTGVIIPANIQYMEPALENTNQNFQAGLTLNLPHDVELELSEHYLMANRAAYENQPTMSNEPSVTVTVPLPQRVNLMGSFTDSRSENTRSNNIDFMSVKDTVMTGLNWSDIKGRGSLGFFYTFEEGTDSMNAWYGGSSSAFANIYEPTAPYNYKNNVLTVNGTAKPIEKLSLNGNVSYTDSEGTFLTSQVFDPYFTGTSAGSTFQAWNPTDLRIVRFGVNAKYDLSKQIALRAGYRRQSWIDRFNSANDGRSDSFDLGFNAKFSGSDVAAPLAKTADAFTRYIQDPLTHCIKKIWIF